MHEARQFCVCVCACKRVRERERAGVAEAKGQFGNPQEVEHLPLETYYQRICEDSTLRNLSVYHSAL
jgi:hypothetical protein